MGVPLFQETSENPRTTWRFIAGQITIIIGKKLEDMGKKNTINGGLVRWENRPTQWKVFQQAVPGGNWNIQAEQAEHVDQVRVD